MPITVSQKTVSTIFAVGVEDEVRRNQLSAVFSFILRTKLQFVDPREVQPDDIAECLLVIVDSSYVPDCLRTARVPVLVLNCDALYDMGMTLATEGEDFGRTNEQSLRINPELLDDKLSAGLTPTFRISKRPGDHCWGNAGDDAITVATYSKRVDQTAVFAYDLDSQMPTRRAPHRRLAFLVSLDPDLQLAPEIDELLQACVAWAIETASPVELSRAYSSRRTRVQESETPVLNPAKELPVADYENWIVDRVNKSVATRMSRFWGGIGITAAVAILFTASTAINSAINQKVEMDGFKVEQKLTAMVDRKFNEFKLDERVKEIVGGVIIHDTQIHKAIEKESERIANEFVAKDLDVMVATAAHKKLKEKKLRNHERRQLLNMYLAMGSKEDEKKLQDEICVAIGAMDQDFEQPQFVHDVIYRRLVFDSYNPVAAKDDTNKEVLKLVLDDLKKDQNPLRKNWEEDYISFLGGFETEHAEGFSLWIRNNPESESAKIVIKAIAQLAVQRHAKKPDKVLEVLTELLVDKTSSEHSRSLRQLAWLGLASIPKSNLDKQKITFSEDAREKTINRIWDSIKRGMEEGDPRPSDWRQDLKCESLARYLQADDAMTLMHWLGQGNPNDVVFRHALQAALVAYVMSFDDRQGFSEGKRDQLAMLIVADKRALYRKDLVSVLDKLVTDSSKNTAWSSLISQLPGLYDTHIKDDQFMGHEVVRELIDHDRKNNNFKATMDLIKKNSSAVASSQNKTSFARIIGPALLRHLDEKKVLDAVVKIVDQESSSAQSGSETTFTNLIGPALSKHLEHPGVDDAVVNILEQERASAGNREAQLRTALELMAAPFNWDSNTKPKPETRIKVVKAILKYLGLEEVPTSPRSSSFVAKRVFDYMVNGDADVAVASTRELDYRVTQMLNGYCLTKNEMGRWVPDPDVFEKISNYMQPLLWKLDTTNKTTLRNELGNWLHRQYVSIGLEDQRKSGFESAKSSFVESETVLRRLLKLNDNSIELYIPLLNSLLRQRNFDAVREEFQDSDDLNRVLGEAPEYVKSRVYEMVAIAFVEIGGEKESARNEAEALTAYQNASEAYRQAIEFLDDESEPNKWATLTHLRALVLLRVGEENTAKNLLNEMLPDLEKRLGSRPSIMHNQRGFSFLGLELYQKALEEFNLASEESVSLRDMDGKKENIGVLELRKKEYEKALEICQPISERGGKFIDERVRYDLPWSSLITAIANAKLASQAKDDKKREKRLTDAKAAWTVWDRGSDYRDHSALRLYFGKEFNWFEQTGKRLLDEVELPAEPLQSITKLHRR